LVAKEFHVSRDTIRKGRYELETGMPIEDAFHLRGRKKVEEKLPHLLNDMKEIVDSQSQTDPNFKTTRLFTRLTVGEIRKQLIEKGYTEEELPSNQTLNTKVNELGYHLKKVKKTKPLKKVKETDDIFGNIQEVKETYLGQKNAVLLSIDTKDRVKVGPFSRGGQNRVLTQTVDHDFGNEFLTPFGILDTTNDHLELFFTESKVTADFMIDALETYWQQEGFKEDGVDTLVIYADNGPENSSRRTQYMKRIIEFSAKQDVKVVLAYYPPYHSKYNPVERAWGVLENHWNGDILDSKETVFKFAQSMTWKGNHPHVTCVNESYETGIKVPKKVMAVYEKMIHRAKGIGKWFVEMNPEDCQQVLEMSMKV